MLLALLLLVAPAVAQENPSIECDNIKDSLLCPSEDNRDTTWDFLNNFSTPCDGFYGCGLSHTIFRW